MLKLGRVGAVAIGAIVAAACVVLAIFLRREGVVLGGAWAGIIGLLGIPIGVLGVWLAWPRGGDKLTAHEESLNVRFQRNVTSGHGTVFAVQDGNQSISYHGTADGVENAPPEAQKGDEK
jgi:hypothetical protein